MPGWTAAISQARKIMADKETMAALTSGVTAAMGAVMEGEVWCARPACGCPGSPHSAALLAGGTFTWEDLLTALRAHAARWEPPERTGAPA